MTYLKNTIQTLSNFSKSHKQKSLCIRPEFESQLVNCIEGPTPQFLARGAGLSYNECNLNKDGLIVDMKRFNHLVGFDSLKGIAICQSATPIKDLFLLNNQFIPPILPGSLHATLGGAIAHDVHGKNNHLMGSFGHHIIWFDLVINQNKYRCSPKENQDLYYATIGGLGLTGIITEVALQLKRAPSSVKVTQGSYSSLQELIQSMTFEGLKHAYQAAWVDLLSPSPRGLLFFADPIDWVTKAPTPVHKIPNLPISFIKPWSINLFNYFYFYHKKQNSIQHIIEFNNPLDSFLNWNNLYGRTGLIQFQGLVLHDAAVDFLLQCHSIIHKNGATPTLAVLKQCTQPGTGLLSFCSPGITIAIDFIHNHKARKAIIELNKLICQFKGKVYMAKDLLLSEEQYSCMYPNKDKFIQILKEYNCSYQSDLSRRIGLC